MFEVVFALEASFCPARQFAVGGGRQKRGIRERGRPTAVEFQKEMPTMSEALEHPRNKPSTRDGIRVRPGGRRKRQRASWEFLEHSLRHNLTKPRQKSKRDEEQAC